MKLSFRHIKSALDFSTTRTAVSDLVKSGKRSVRVITEEQVIRLIEVLVEDALANSSHIPPEERERVVAAAKEHFDAVMEQQAETEERNKRQEETILSLQQRITQLINEKQTLTAAQKQLEQHLDAALRHAAMAAQPTAGAAADDRTPEALSRMANELAQVQQWLARMESKGPSVASSATSASSGTTTDMDARLEASVQKLIDRFGRTVANATSKPIESRREATSALLGKVFENDSPTESNIGDLDVEERKAEGDIQRSLDRLRRNKRSAAPAAKPAAKPTAGPAANPAASPAASPEPEQTATEDRREGAPDRRQDPQADDGTGEERREGPQDRRSS